MRSDQTRYGYWHVHSLDRVHPGDSWQVGWWGMLSRAQVEVRNRPVPLACAWGAKDLSLRIELVGAGSGAAVATRRKRLERLTRVDGWAWAAIGRHVQGGGSRG